LKPSKALPILVISVALLAGVAFLLGWTNVLSVKSIAVVDSNPARKLIATEALKIDDLIGRPIARVDRRELSSQLRTYNWVDRVEISRNFFTGEIRVSVKAKTALAELESPGSSGAGLSQFLAEDLSIISIASDQAEFLSKSELLHSNAKLPKASLASENLEVKGVVKELLTRLRSWQVSRIDAPEIGNLSSTLIQGTRQLEVYWGNVNEIELKIQVLERLLELRENKNAKSFDLSNPLSPIANSKN
jgi:hypothetical protein